MPAMSFWWRSSGCRWRGLSIAAANSSSGGGGQASGPRLATISSSATAAVGSSFAQARCLVPNSRSRSSRPSSSRTSTREARSLGEARLSKTRSRPADIRWISSARSPNSTTGILPTRRTAGQLAPRQRFQRRLEGLHHVHPRRQRRFDPGSRQAGVQPARDDLDLRQLGHRTKSAASDPRRKAQHAVDFCHVHSTGFGSGSASEHQERKGSCRSSRRSNPLSDRSSSPEEIAELSEEIRALAAAAQRGHPRPQLPAAGDPGRRQLPRRLARPLAPGGGHRRRGDRLLRRPLHGRDRLDPLAREDGADPRPRRRLLARRLDHRRPAARLEGRAPRRAGGDVRQHLGRGQGRDRLLLHLLQRGQGGRAHLGRARRRDRDPLRPRHVARRLRRARDRAASRTPSGAAASTSGTASATSTPASGPTTSPAPGPNTPRPSS